jgi:hypothetical protein
LWRLASIGQRLYITRVSFPLQFNGHRGVLLPLSMAASFMLRGLAISVCTDFSYDFCAKIYLAYLDFTADTLSCVSKYRYIEFGLTFILQRSLRMLLQFVVALRPQLLIIYPRPMDLIPQRPLILQTSAVSVDQGLLKQWSRSCWITPLSSVTLTGKRCVHHSP